MQGDVNHEFFENAGQQVQATQSYPLITQLLLWAGAVGPLLFVVVLLIEGATRPGYSAWHTFGSSLSWATRDGCKLRISSSVDF